MKLEFNSALEDPRLQLVRDVELPLGYEEDYRTPPAHSLPVIPSRQFEESDRSDRSAAPAAQETKRGTRETPNKGDFGILRGKQLVNVEVARRYLGVTRRAIEKAAKKGSIETRGKRQNRMISVESLCEYLPPSKMRTDAN